MLPGSAIQRELVLLRVGKTLSVVLQSRDFANQNADVVYLVRGLCAPVRVEADGYQELVDWRHAIGERRQVSSAKP